MSPAEKLDGRSDNGRGSFDLTPAMRAYIAEFDRLLLARHPRAIIRAREAMTRELASMRAEKHLLGRIDRELTQGRS